MSTSELGSPANNGGGGDKKSIVQYAADSEASLDDLFEVLSSQTSAKAGKPMTQRQLPQSFFQANELKRFHPSALGGGLGPGGNHPRSMSLPATMPVDMGHPILDGLQLPVPPGWEAAKTPDGHHYYIE